MSLLLASKIWAIYIFCGILSSPILFVLVDFNIFYSFMDILVDFGDKQKNHVY